MSENKWRMLPVFWNENVQQGKVSKNVQYCGKIKEICIT